MPTPYNEYLTPEEKANGNNLYDFKITGDIDKLTLKGGDPLKAYLGETSLTAKDMGDYYAYSDGNGHQWSYPKSKLEDTSNLNAYQRLEDGWKKSSAYGFDKMMLGTLGLGISPFIAMEAAPYLATLANGSADAAMATRAGQLANRVLTSPYGKAGLSSIFGGMGMHNFFSDNGYAKTLQEWNNLKNDPSFYNAVNFGKSAAGDVMDVTMMAPLYKPLTYISKQGLENGKNFVSRLNDNSGIFDSFNKANASKKYLLPFQIQRYPGYQLKNLMSGNALEKQLSKNGTVSVNSIRAHINKGSNVEKAVVNKVLSSEQFVGQKAIDYNDFRKAVQDELITYERIPSEEWADYGFTRLGYKNPAQAMREWDIAFNELMRTYPYRRDEELIQTTNEIMGHKKDIANLNTYTFESPRIPIGNAKHYNPNTLGHSRTYTTKDEPDILHVMESQSDWAQNYGKTPKFKVSENGRTNVVFDEDAVTWKAVNDGTGIEYSEIKDDPSIMEHLNNIFTGYDSTPQSDYLASNYLQRQLQENLKYAAEHGQTKMRYPTAETAAKIEGYSEKYLPEDESKARTLEDAIFMLKLKNSKLSDLGGFGLSDNLVFDYSEPKEQVMERLQKELDVLQARKAYLPEHQTILKKYSSFPKQYSKLYKGAEVRVVTDSKGNTWYEVDVPKDYLNQEWQYAYGGPLVQQANMFKGGGPKKKLSDKEYYSIMERVAQENNPIWNKDRIKSGEKPLSVDEEYLRILNDNSYDYRGFYNNNPVEAANASTHWPDDYKTVYHPTFSIYSKYSGKTSDFNPLGLEGGRWPEGPVEAEEKDFQPAWWQSIPNTYTGRWQYQDGGQINTYKQWQDLPIKERADIMKVAIRNGITNLADIKAKYNEFALGGNTYSGTQSGSQQMNQGYVYDVLPNLLAMDGVNVRVSSGYRLGSTTKRGKASRHSTHEAADIIPINGSTFADIDRVINDPNSNTSKWMMANGYGYIDETSATGTTKYWKDHNKDHSHYHIGRDSMYAKQYAAKIGGGIQNSNMQNGNYRDIAKQHIRQNESWRAKPYADGPNGWRSVGYGFNDSGFYAKYPGGISNYYAQRGGITKEEAEKELDWYLDRMEADLRRTYGSKWDSFNDNQKAAIMDTYYQRPASVSRNSAFYSAIMSGNPNAVNLLGVDKYDTRNTDRRNLFSAAPVQMRQGVVSQPQENETLFAFEPSNPQAFFAPLSSYETPVEQPVTQPLVDVAEQQYKAEMAERQRAMQQNNNMLALVSYLNNSGNQDSSPFGVFNLLSGNQIEV